jgi:hypothetical protein
VGESGAKRRVRVAGIEHSLTRICDYFAFFLVN